MKIAVNTRLLIKGKMEGMGWFIYETLKRITINHKEHQFIFIFDRDYSEDFIFSENIIPVVARPKARHPFLFPVWFDYCVPRVLKKYNAELFLSPDGYLSLTTKVPQIAVIHDLSFVHRPHDLPLLKSRYYNHFFPKFAEKANRIATVSNYSKDDIVKSYNIDKSIVDVVYCGVSKNYIQGNIKIQRKIRDKYTNGDPFFLFVGALHPRKNIPKLIHAFELFKKKGGKEKLIIVGEKMHKTKEISRVLKQVTFVDDILFTGRVDEKELPYFYSAAKGLIFISFFEGFGIPVLEAMSSGIPVICSNRTSLPEVGGNAVLYVNPDDKISIVEAMQAIANLDDLRKELVTKGLQQKNLFSWDKTADLLWNTIEKVIYE